MTGHIGTEKTRMKKFWTDLNKVWVFTKYGRRRAMIAAALMFAATMILTFMPYLLGRSLDHIPSQSVLYLDIGNISWVLVLAGSMVLIWYVLMRIGMKVYVDNISMGKARVMFLKKIDNKHIDEVECHSTGEFVSYLSNDMNTVSNLLFADLPNLVESVVIVLTVLVFMFFTNVQLALVYLLIFVITTFIIRYIGRRMRTDVEQSRNDLFKMNAFLDDAYSNRSLIKLYGLESRAKHAFSSMNSSFSRAYLNLYRLVMRVDPIGRIIENLGFISTSILGIALLSESYITAGMLLTFVSYASLLGNPLIKITTGINSIQYDMVSLRKISSFLESDEIDRSGRNADGLSGRISVDNVSFSYGDKMVLDKVSFDIEEGDMVTFIGSTGSGKSTMIDLLLGIRQADSGRVLYDGIDVDDYDKYSLRSSVNLCPTVPWIFNGTILENIRYVDPGASLEDVTKASETVGFDRIVSKKPNGYDTLLGEKGITLSAGEAQTLSLVRVLLMDPKVVILDESMSLMDPTMKKEIRSKVISALQGKTIIMVTGDESFLDESDLVVHFESGHVILDDNRTSS